MVVILERLEIPVSGTQGVKASLHFVTVLVSSVYPCPHTSPVVLQCVCKNIKQII